MTTTTTFQGMEPGSKSSSRVLRPPGGGSNISLGADEEKVPVRKNKMASSVFAEPEDPYANRRNNPPGGKPSGVLCGESSAPLRRGGNSAANHSGELRAMDGENSVGENVSVMNQDTTIENKARGKQTLFLENCAADPEPAPEPQDDPSQAEEPAAGAPSGRRNPPGGKSSLILG